MSRNARRAGPRLRIPSELLDALERLEGEALDAGPAVRRIAAGVIRLNRGLTQARTGFGGYLRDPELRAAYRNYYLCTNAPKLWPVLDRLAARGLLPPAGGRALELGCGPGTGVVGLALWAAARGHRWQLRATDTLREATTAAAELMETLGHPLETALVDLASMPPSGLGGPWDLVLCLNVVNELEPRHDARLLGELRAALAPRGLLLVIEPASSAESRRVLGLRDRAVADGWCVVAPCPHNAACPALAAADGWCHGEWHFERPAFVRAVDQQTGLLREVLKATWFVLAPPGAALDGGQARLGGAELPPDGVLARVTSARRDAKGRSEVEVCMEGALRRLELQTRDRTPGNEDFFDLSRHDLAVVVSAAVGQIPALAGRPEAPVGVGPAPAVRPAPHRLGSRDTVVRLDETH